MLSSFGVTYTVKAGCWGVKPLDFNFNEDMLPVFFIEPGTAPTCDQLDEMIEHYVYLEEYEKCHFLKEFKKKLN